MTYLAYIFGEENNYISDFIKKFRHYEYWLNQHRFVINNEQLHLLIDFIIENTENTETIYLNSGIGNILDQFRAVSNLPINNREPYKFKEKVTKIVIN